MAFTTVHVIFVDGGTGRTIAHSEVPVDQLPASFALSTTMHLGDEDWHVEKAEPVTVEEFRRTGALTLTLSRVTYMDPKKIPFTLPTLEVTMPQLDESGTASGRHTLELDEDDWRQIEFVSAKYMREIEAELADIQTIYREQSVDNGSFLGFRAIHMRKRLPEPIDSPFPRGDVLAAIGSYGSSFDAIFFRNVLGVVPAAFVVRAGDVVLYGAGEGDSVRYLCIRHPVSSPAEPVLSNMLQLMAAHELYLVDWRRMMVLGPSDPASFAQYFAGQ